MSDITNLKKMFLNTSSKHILTKIMDCNLLLSKKKICIQKKANAINPTIKNRIAGKRFRYNNYFELSENIKTHIKNVEGINGSGISGGHCFQNFVKSIPTLSRPILITDLLKIPNAEGLYCVKYVIFKKNQNNIIHNEFSQILEKTVYIGKSKLSKEVITIFKRSTKLTKNILQNLKEIEDKFDKIGYTDSAFFSTAIEALRTAKLVITKNGHNIFIGCCENGVRFLGWLEGKNKRLKSVYPVLNLDSLKNKLTNTDII